MGPDTFEARLVGYSKQARKDGDWVEVRFHIHPDDVTPALAQAPLKTTFMVAAVPVEAQSEKPERNVLKEAEAERQSYLARKPKRKWSEIPLAEQAGVRCETPQFQEWILARANLTADNDEHRKHLAVNEVREICHVSSRADLENSPTTRELWRALDQEYQKAAGLIAEEH